MRAARTPAHVGQGHACAAGMRTPLRSRSCAYPRRGTRAWARPGAPWAHARTPLRSRSCGRAPTPWPCPGACPTPQPGCARLKKNRPGITGLYRGTRTLFRDNPKPVRFACYSRFGITGLYRNAQITRSASNARYNRAMHKFSKKIYASPRAIAHFPSTGYTVQRLLAALSAGKGKEHKGSCSIPGLALPEICHWHISGLSPGMEVRQCRTDRPCEKP